MMLIKRMKTKTIYLAGGCFWGVEGYFSRIDGIVSTEVGYANGKTEDTSYEELKITEHAETLKLEYDIAKISLEEILLHFFRIIDPTSIDRQGFDIGRQYRTGVYYTDESDREIIDKIFEYETKIHGELAVECEPLSNFVVAEEYHQDYLEKNPRGYCHINLNKASEPLFRGEYENPSDEALQKILDGVSYSVMRKSATESPGTSKLNDEWRKGIYVDKITGEPLFASKDKFNAGCGWPSFSKTILQDKVKYVEDKSFYMDRTEVRSAGGDNHLGHIFDDGPLDMGGMRYCINGAALEFIPYEDMDERGYADYKILCE